MWREENRRTRRKTLRAGTRTNNKLNPHKTPSQTWATLVRGKCSPAAPSLNTMIVFVILSQYFYRNSWLSWLSTGLPCGRSWVQTPAGPPLGVFKYLRRKCCLCNDICKWLDFLVFSDKEDKPEVPSHNT